MSKWENYGDVNFDIYGGCLVKPHWSEEEIVRHPDLKNQFDVFYLIPKNETGEDFHLASMHCVEVDDFIQSDKRNELLHFIGLEEQSDRESYEIMAPELWAKEIVEAGYSNPSYTYKSRYPSSNEDWQISDSQLVDFMNNIEAEEFLLEYADKGLREGDIKITTEELVIEDNYIEAQFELWCDVDTKFDTDTRDDDGAWVNFYVHYFPEETVPADKIKAFYVVCTDEENEYFDYILSDSERTLVEGQMQERARLEAGCGLDELFDHFHSDIER